mgnify:CR=1 FL=1
MDTHPQQGGGSAPESAAPPAGSPVVGVKIRPPALRTDVVRRSRLTDTLHASRARVVLVSAPAGFGKTVLALDWLAGRNEPVAWLSLDALDNDADRFFVHLGAALGRVPGLRELPGLLRPEHGRAGPGNGLRRPNLRMLP